MERELDRCLLNQKEMNEGPNAWYQYEVNFAGLQRAMVQ
jgi:hypothetical protein